MPKINIPMGLKDGELNLTDESKYLNKLIYKTDRTNSGLGFYTSQSSGISYSTDDYPNDENIYNKGEVGLIYIFWKIYGGDDGFLIMAENANSYTRPSGKKIESSASLNNADTLDGNPSSYYLNYKNFNNTPSIPSYSKLYNIKLLSSNWNNSSELEQLKGFYYQKIAGLLFTPSQKVDVLISPYIIEEVPTTIFSANINGEVYVMCIYPPNIDIDIQIVVSNIEIIVQ